MNNQPVVLNIQYTPYQLGRGASDSEIAEHKENRRFYDMTGGDNVYKYITTEGKLSGKRNGQITALEYLQKSTGVFNGGGMISQEEVDRMKLRLQQNKGNIWHGFISLNEEQSHKIDTPEKCIGLIKETFGSFLTDAHFSKENIDLMCALHLDKPHHLHIHFVFWEKKATYKDKNGNMQFRRKGRIDMSAIDGLFARVGLYIEDNHHKLYETRVEAIKKLREMTAYKKIFDSSEEIKKEIISLARDLPKTGRIAYGSKDMESFRGRVDKIVDMLVSYDEGARKADQEFCKALDDRRRTLVYICGKEYALVQRNVKLSEIERNLPKYHNKIDMEAIKIIEEIQEDYKYRRGNLVLKLAKNINPEILEAQMKRPKKVNSRKYKRSLLISRSNMNSLFNKFLRSFSSNERLLERDFSHRLQDIEKEMEEKRKEEERKEANYKY